MNIPDDDFLAAIESASKAHFQLCNLWSNAHRPKADPEAWREEYRKKQAAGVRFEVISDGGNWHKGNSWKFDGNKEYYREVPQEVQKEGDMRIPEASEIRKWADRYYSLWCFVENSLPRDASSDTFDIFRGYARQVNDEIYGVTDKAKEPHAAERALWKAQREAGTNEVWQQDSAVIPNGWLDFPIDIEPAWRPDCKYRVKPMKLTAKIVRNIPMTFWQFWDRVHDWEFFGTREEYRAECEKYGYVVISEIKEVVEKPETVKYYFALFKITDGRVGTGWHKDKQKLTDYWIKTCGYTIIGDIEEREIEA